MVATSAPGLQADFETYRRQVQRAVVGRVWPFDVLISPADLSLALPFPLGVLKRDPRCVDPAHFHALERAREAALLLADFGEGTTGIEVADEVGISRGAAETLLTGRRLRTGNAAVDEYIDRVRRSRPDLSSPRWTPAEADWEPSDDGGEYSDPHGRRVTPAAVPLYYARGRIRRWGSADERNASAMWEELGRWMVAGALVAEIDLRLAAPAFGQNLMLCRCQSVRYWLTTRPQAIPRSAELWRVDALRDSDVFRAYGYWSSYRMSIIDVERDAAGYASAYFDVMKWQMTPDYPEGAFLSLHLLALTGHRVFDIWSA